MPAASGNYGVINVKKGKLSTGYQKVTLFDMTVNMYFDPVMGMSMF